MECFTVQSKDLLDKSKNPNLSLSAKDILNNPKIPKTPIVQLPKVKVENMCGSTYSKVANQFIVRTENATYFQSYQTVIVCHIDGQTYLDENSWDYSTTTGKYRNKFLGETKKETEAKIKTGEYILANLN